VKPDVKVVVTEKGLMIRTALPGLRSRELQIIFAGSNLRILSTQCDGFGPFDVSVELPPGFDADQATAAYIGGELRITIPPAQSSSQRIDFLDNSN
jgi:HSP20 family molecular chaperone IbpA